MQCNTCKTNGHNFLNRWLGLVLAPDYDFFVYRFVYSNLKNTPQQIIVCVFVV